MVLRECLRVINKIPTSMGCLMRDDTEKLEAATVLKGSVISHIRYLQNLERQKERERLGKDPQAPKRKSDNSTKAESYGLDPKRDLPDELPLGETTVSQEEKCKVLQEMSDQGVELNANIVSLMKMTYTTQRVDIKNRIPMDDFIKRWPYFGMVSGPVYTFLW